MQDPVTFTTRYEWRAWLIQHHLTATEIWLVITKKSASPRNLSYNDAVEEAIAFGWIDGKMKSLDGQRFMQRYTPRRPASTWSETNIERAKAVIAEGLMTEQGLRVYEDGVAAGRIVPSAKTFSIPTDLEAAISENEKARENFSTMPPSARLMFVHWIDAAKKANTRAERIRKSVVFIAENKRLTDVFGPAR